MSAANERQVGGDHYRKAEGEQHWDRAVRLELDFFQYQITKYVERCWEKNGIQDLEKALHFTQKYIEVARARGLRGAKEKVVDPDAEEAAIANAAVVDWLMQHEIVTESGTYTMPDGSKYTCIQGKPSDFEWEGGFGDGRVMYTCTGCREKVYTLPRERPQTVHKCSKRGDASVLRAELDARIERAQVVVSHNEVGNDGEPLYGGTAA